MRLPLLLFYICIVIAEIVGEMTQNLWLIYTFKPAIMLTLMGWLIFTKDLKSYFLLFVGMLFAMLGDVFLMIRGANLFVAGLGAFLVMQLCYILYFIKKGVRWAWLPIFIFGIYGVVFLSQLLPALSDNILKTAVVAYATALCGMGAMAACRQATAKSYYWVLFGAVLFILSDSLIALNRFLSPIPNASLLIMTTYVAAQWLIVRGLFVK